jgi:hypothetical protein
MRWKKLSSMTLPKRFHLLYSWSVMFTIKYYKEQSYNPNLELRILELRNLEMKHVPKGSDRLT